MLTIEYINTTTKQTKKSTLSRNEAKLTQSALLKLYELTLAWAILTS